MAADLFLDLLGSIIGPELTSSDRARLSARLGPSRSGDARPWPSGVPDTAAPRPDPRSEIDELRERVAWLELSLKLLCDLLAESSAVPSGALASRLRAIRDQVETVRAEKERTVECVSCKARIPREDAHVRATGTLCPACHTGAGKRAPRMQERRIEGTGGYRDAGRVELVEESKPCASCRKEVPLSKGFNSAAGLLCASCHLELNE